MLHSDTSGNGPRVVLVHGFTQTGRSWAPVLGALSADHEVLTVDLPGHGDSATVRADLWESARLVGEVGGPAAYVGYSMGGRVLLHLALLRPDLVQRMIVVGATAGIEDEAARSERRAADERLAQALETDGLDAFLERWLAGPLFSTLDPGAANIADRRRNTVEGLASSLRQCGTGTQDPPLWNRLGEIGSTGVPVLVVAGEHDPKFQALGQRLVAAIGPTARLEVVPGAGHAAHLERPDRFLGVIRPFLTETTPV